MGIASKRGQMKYVRLLLWGMYEEMAHSFFKVGQCPLGHNWSTYFTKDHCTLVFSNYIYKIIFKTLIHLKLCQRHNGPKALSTFTQNDTFSWKQKLQQALKSWSSWLLFCSDINKMAFVFIRHQQHDFSFVLASTTWFSFVLMSTTWLSKLTRVGKERLRNFWRGCVNIYIPGSHQSSLKKTTDWINNWQDKAIIGVGSDKNHYTTYVKV